MCIRDRYDAGADDPSIPVPYHEAAERVALPVQRGEYDFGVTICGTGMGVAQVVNKFRGVYGALVETPYTARMSRVINDANVLCLGAWIPGREMTYAILDAFFGTAFNEGMDVQTSAFNAACRRELDERFGQV